MRATTARWVYVLSADFSWRSGLRFDLEREFRSADGVARLVVSPGGRLTVKKGYAWDGCSPKFQICDLLVGVPDGATDKRTGLPKTYHASLIHDVLCQFMDHSGVTWSQADECFLRLLEEADFAPRRLYYWAVRVWGVVRRCRRPRRTAML